MSPQPPPQRPRGAEARLEQRLASYLAQQMRRVLELSGPAIVAGDEEAIHKLRVALRRARSAFRTFAPWFRKKSRRRAERPLRELGRVLAAVRDLDALRARIGSDELASLRTGHPDGAAVLDARLAARRARRAAGLPGSLDHEELAAALRNVERAVEDLKASSVDPRAELGVQVARFVAAAEPLLREAAREDEHEAQHRLRIEAKRLRYALEVLEPLLAGTARAAIAAVREVQDRLGLLQDLAVLRELCKEVVPDAPELAEHLERIRRHEHAELLRPPGLDRGLLEALRALTRTSERTAAHEAGA